MKFSRRFTQINADLISVHLRKSAAELLSTSQRFQKPDELPLLYRRQRLICRTTRRRLSRVAQDGLVERKRLRTTIRRRAGRAPVVHKFVARPQPPQRRRPDLVSG